jgi:hypothetical protein
MQGSQISSWDGTAAFLVQSSKVILLCSAINLERSESSSHVSFVRIADLCVSVFMIN